MAVGPRWVFVALKQLPQQHPAAAFDGVDVHLILHLDDVAVFFQQEPQMRIVQPAFTAEALEGDLREIAAEEIRRPLQATFQPVRCVARAAGNVGAKKDIPLCSTSSQSVLHRVVHLSVRRPVGEMGQPVIESSSSR